MQRCMRNRTERINKWHRRGEENRIFVDNTTYLTKESGEEKRSQNRKGN